MHESEGYCEIEELSHQAFMKKLCVSVPGGVGCGGGEGDAHP